MPGQRRLSRVYDHNQPNQSHSSQSSHSPPTTVPNGQVQPQPPMKHIRLPPLKRESALTFELIIGLHVVLFMGLQFLHLYRTVWWLPQSFNSSGMNFHLIDGNLILFILSILCRRVPYLLLKPYLNQKLLLLIATATTGFLVGFSAYRIVTSFVQLLYLFLPTVLYIYVYGASLRNIFELDDLDHPRVQTHYCTTDPTSIREECELLRTLFNQRVKGIVCLSGLIAYYSSFLPWCFVQPYVSYDLWWVTQHLILSWMYTFSLLMSRAFCPDFSDGMHKAACHLGKWNRLRIVNLWNMWTPELLFPPGSVVKHNRELYKAEGVTAAEPGNATHQRFQLLFTTSSFPRLLLGFQVAVIILTFIILTRTMEWYQLISITSLLVTSTHTFIRLSRDFIVVWKLYQAEEIILNSNS